MDRRAFISTLAGGLVGAPLAAESQSAVRAIKLGILSTVNPRTTTFTEAMIKRLGELGYVEGQTLAVEFRNAQGDVARLPTLAAELVRLNVDVILASGPEVTLQAGPEGDNRGPDCDRRSGLRPDCSRLRRDLGEAGGQRHGCRPAPDRADQQAYAVP